MNLLKKGLLNIGIQKKKVNSDLLIYNYKTEEKSLKDFRNDQNQIELFKNLEDGNVNPREILKIKIRTSNKCNTKC